MTGQVGEEVRRQVLRVRAHLPLARFGEQTVAFVRAHEERSEPARAVEVLAHRPLHGVALVFAHRAVVEARIAGHHRERVERVVAPHHVDLEAPEGLAAARGLDPRHQFGAVLSEAARLAGYSLEAPRGESSTAPSRGESPPADPSRVKASSVQLPPEPPAYPDEREVADVWAASRTIEGDEQARAYLASRAIDPVRVAALDLARVLPIDFRGPSWARYQGKPWAAAGYRLLVPMVDAHGALRSLRAWRLAGSSEDPKRVAPAGKAMAGLVMACPIARRVLQTGQSAAEGPLDVVITEGEPDFLTHAARPEGAAAPAVVGVVASAWSSAVADRLLLLHRGQRLADRDRAHRRPAPAQHLLGDVRHAHV